MTPTTEAGLALAAEYRRWFTEQGWEAEGWDPLGSEANLTRDILAIEDEAREQERARIRTAVEALPGTDPFARALGLSSVAREVVSRAAVLAAIDRSEP